MYMTMGDATSDATAAIQNYLINTLYPQILNRAPLPTGLAFWTNAALQNNWTPDQLKASFISGSAPELATQAYIKSQLPSLQPNIGDYIYWDLYDINNDVGNYPQLLVAMQKGQQQAIAAAVAAAPVTAIAPTSTTIPAAVTAPTITTPAPAFSAEEQSWIATQLVAINPATSSADVAYWSNYAVANNLPIGSQLLAAMQAGAAPIAVTTPITSAPATPVQTSVYPITQTPAPTDTATAVVSTTSPLLLAGLALAAFAVLAR